MEVLPVCFFLKNVLKATRGDLWEKPSSTFLLVLAELSFTSRLALLALLKARVQPCSSSQPFEFKLRGEFSLFEGAYMRHNARFPLEKGRKKFRFVGYFQDFEYQHRVYCVAVAARSTLNGSEHPVSKVGNGLFKRHLLLWEKSFSKKEVPQPRRR